MISKPRGSWSLFANDRPSVSSIVLHAGWKTPYLRALSTRRAVVLMYHGISRNDDAHSISLTHFKQQIEFLKENFEIIPPERLFERRKAQDKIRVLLTFDDGFQNHVDVLAPELMKSQTPALFFIPSRHSKKGKYLWFNYLRAFDRYFASETFTFRGASFHLGSEDRAASLKRLTRMLLDLRPHPSAMYEVIENEFPALEDFVPVDRLADFYSGMAPEQIAQLASVPFFEIGAHTVTHPFLSRCDAVESLRELKENKQWLEDITERPCIRLAYPSGDYDGRILAQCQECGFAEAFAVAPTLNKFAQLEIPRIGLYPGDSLDDLGFKVQWGNLARAINVYRH